jgi:hypothetical protein
MKTSFITIILTIATVLAVRAQDVRYLSFKQEKLAYAPAGYYINDVVDERENKNIIGHINANGAANDLAFQVPVASALNAFIRANVTQRTDAVPITLHIQKLDVSVRKNGAIYNVSATISFAFYAGDNRVEQFNGGANGQTDKDPYVYSEQLIRQNLETYLKKFGEWWSQNKANVVTKKGVKVNVTMGQTIDLPNTIVYSLSRPLSIADFTGTPEGGGPELAITASGAGLRYESGVSNGETVVNVVITPYFDKTRSWFREEGKTPYVLAHEQAHFDITAINTCEFIDAVKKASFTPENYVQKLQALEEEYARKRADMQDAYDGATNHGIIHEQQAIWQNKIKDEVRTVGCY